MGNSCSSSSARPASTILTRAHIHLRVWHICTWRACIAPRDSYPLLIILVLGWALAPRLVWHLVHIKAHISTHGHAIRIQSVTIMVVWILSWRDRPIRVWIGTIHKLIWRISPSFLFFSYLI